MKKEQLHNEEVKNNEELTENMEDMKETYNELWDKIQDKQENKKGFMEKTKGKLKTISENEKVKLAKDFAINGFVVSASTIVGLAVGSKLGLAAGKLILGADDDDIEIIDDDEDEVIELEDLEEDGE